MPNNNNKNDMGTKSTTKTKRVGAPPKKKKGSKVSMHKPRIPLAKPKGKKKK